MYTYTYSVYFGGPEDQGEKGLMIHGIANLRGAHEISPGTGIYCGGEVDAVEGVLSGVLFFAKILFPSSFIAVAKSMPSR